MAGSELTAEDFLDEAAMDRAQARLLADHFNTMHAIANLEIVAIYEKGLLNIDLMKETLGIEQPSSSEASP